MSMYDRCYCVTHCKRSNCERNLGYHKPHDRIYTASDLDSQDMDDRHLRCLYFSPIEEEYEDE